MFRRPTDKIRTKLLREATWIQHLYAIIENVHLNGARESVIPVGQSVQLG
jgi:hypothetical protein